MSEKHSVGPDIGRSGEPAASHAGPVTRRELLRLGAVGTAALSGAGLLGVGLPAAYAAGRRAMAAAGGGTLIVGDFDVANSLDSEGPALDYVPNINAISALNDPVIYNGYKKNPMGPGTTIDGATYTPMLAESWKHNRDGSVWEFKVRKGVRSNHGHELTSADFVYLFQRASGLKGTGAFIFSFLMKVKAVRAVDKYTVQFVCTGPSPGVLPYISTSFPSMYVLDSTEVKKHATHADPWAGKWLAQNYAGFGPYELSNWTPGQSMEFTARTDYWGPTPKFTTVKYLAIPNASSRQASLSNGAIDIGLTMPQQGITALLKDKKIRVFQYDGNYGVWLWPNEIVPGLKNVKVRQAMAYAIPYEQIISQVYAGRGRLPKTLFPDYVPYSDPSFWHYNTNPAKALSVMKSSGQGPFTVPLSYPSGDPEMAEVAAVLQSAWAPLGITLTLNADTESNLVTKQAGKNIPLMLADWDSPIAPDGIITTAFWTTGGALNNVHYSNKQFDALYKAGADTFDPKKRAAIYKRAQQMMAETLPMILVALFNVTVPATQKVTNYTWYPDHAIRFQSVR